MSTKPLAGCYVISLRPVGDHAALRRAAAAQGARVLALSPWKRVPRQDPQTHCALGAALACERVVFSSPFAVRAAQALQPLRERRNQHWFAIGSGTAHALHRAGIASASSPLRMDSEGLLDMPELQAVAGGDVGLVTAPGGRDRLADELESRGANIVRADVYERCAVALSPRAIARVLDLDASLWLALSSGEALRRTLAALPPPAIARLQRAPVVAGSARLRDVAKASGFDNVSIAASARPRDLVHAMASASMAARRSTPDP
jgi:uroporphyrinogen-III synthase